MNAAVLYAKSFGAVGDGITDDGPALSRAFRSAAQAGACLMLDGEKTYRVLSAENRAVYFETPFAAEGCSGFSLNGCGATVLCAPGIRYFAFSDCADFAVEHIRFDCDASVYYVGTVTDCCGHDVTFETDIPVRGDTCTFGGSGFSIQYNDGTQQRPHRFFSVMRRLDDHHVSVTYHDENVYRTGDIVFLPAMDIGHMYGEPVYIGGSRGAVILSDVTILASPSFTCAVKHNEADITFRRFHMLPSDRHGHERRMVAWRDGFHCKDNRGSLLFEDCEIGVLFDDVFNISATLGEVLSVPAPDTLCICNQEFHRHMSRDVPYNVRVGDILDLYDYDRDLFHGTVTVTAVSDSDTHTTVTLSEPIEGIRPGCSVGNHMTCAPHSRVKNCRLTGTMRFRGPCVIEDTEIDLLLIWLMVEGDVEGPIPRDIVFRRCTFRGGAIEVRGYNRPADLLLPNIEKQISGITFEDCRMDTRIDAAEDIKIMVC